MTATSAAAPTPPQDPFADCLALDQRRLRALTRDLRHGFGAKRDALLAERDTLVEKSRAAVAERRARLPIPVFADDLPVNGRRAEIAALIAGHQVLIVCGETGSGKTTQIPKICLDIGRGTTGLIGHTQPRRIAARSTAARIAQELQSEVGRLVGYKIRFSDRTTPDALIKLMTDGILLAETQGDSWLEQYDTLIIDEAHERSLNIDFLLGYLKQLLPKRRDLKLIITSATIDAQRFARHFDDAPVIEVSGRLHPVELRYRPLQKDDGNEAGGAASGRSERGDDQRDLCEAIVDACNELDRAGPGDVLVFLPGEREIREAAEALRKHHPPHTEILPLFARLSAEEQGRIFKPHVGRRIVLATNVAETSLTVPGIRYVVDSGLARIKRYSYRNKVEQLQIEKIAQASANQRAGRCGRVAAGVCIRLYEEQDFALRPEYSEPEILRSSLAGVILRMKALRLGDIEDFPFLEAPSRKAIGDGYQLLLELGAVTADNALTATGQELAGMPLDPRLGRMIVAARDEGCLREVLVIAAALSVQDPRERPQDRQGSADTAHQKFADPKSEFLSWLKLWDWYQAEVEHRKSQRKLVQTCHDNFLSALRMREWRDIHAQLHSAAAEYGWRVNQVPASYDAVHRALLAGLLGNIGCKSEDSAHYLGARGIKMLIHPGSALQKKAGKWIVAAEISETTRLFARCVARIEPGWLELVGAHLLKRSHFDPHWEKKAMQVVAFERITLYGIVVDPRRRVNFGPLNPPAARELFIRQALVAGEVSEEFARRWDFFNNNQQLVLDIETLEHKSRRPDVLVDDELIFAFYDQIVPEGIYSGASFDKWRRGAERGQPRLLHLVREDLMRHEAAGITSEAFPHQLQLGSVDYPLAYHFEPGSARDGVTLTLPLAQLNQIPAARCEWLVPGLLKEKVQQLVKTLPQRIRAKLVPVPDFASEFVDQVPPADKPLVGALVSFILQSRGLNARGWDLTPDAFRPDAVPPHLSFNFRLVDENGRQLGVSRSLTELRSEWGREAKQEFAELHDQPAEFSGMTDWSFGELAELIEVEVGGGQTVFGYPGLTDDGDSVSVCVFDSPEEALQAHASGLLRLFMLQFREQIKYLEKNLPGLTQMAMQFMALGTLDELRRQLLELTFTRACLNDPWPTDAESFNVRCLEAKQRVGLLAQEVCRLVGQILGDWLALHKKLPVFKAYGSTVHDIEGQLARLIGKRFIVNTPFERLQQFPRYLQAISVRLDKLKTGGAHGAARDSRLLAEYLPLWTNYQRRATVLAKQGVSDPQVEQFRWLLEELRVHLFAQALRTPVPVSSKRLQKMWEGIQ
ncbi:MAG: ATP-dependent RNA helicase HrpB [Candidatus Accumulibacter regalis]|uniref:ATP-dependent RNA helicase HrpB n=1 Tax=Accumulibacter regalis TaxID=522306 RepID=A0A011NRB0_ACCRE|nr:ATP-dependent RNA helicase HrpA [Accumulibacter sp.]EXI85293.1 MAG: ATP-dependent RNA helicase HrpB [Candidatus Accumulibacter regalis]HRE71137.1 ATP-dependent RNA helicase HrpA [Accumulibacter sp.]